MDLYPMRLRPCYKEYLWGGERLKKEFGKKDAPNITAESWELASRDEGESVVAEGPLLGMTVKELGELDHAAFWGADCPGGAFPLLVKLIDAKNSLSVQVHPSDETALEARGEQGKLEMWYIVDCIPQAAIYYGFSKRMDETKFLRYAREGRICQVLNRVPVTRGDVFYILPGTIHAIGAGIVIAEIQQSSDTTFRVYDFQRRDADGKLRSLHLDRAAKVLNYKPVVPSECRANSSAIFPEFALSEMFSCRYFHAFRLDVHTTASLGCDGKSFQHLLCVEGNGIICFQGKKYSFGRGDSYFLPAALGHYQIEGACRMLLSRL